GASLMGLMVTKSGLARRLALIIMRRAGRSVPRVLFGVLVASCLITFIIPSAIARVVLLGSICVGIVEALGLKKGSNAGKCLFTAVTVSSTLFSKGVLASSAPLLGRAFIERYTGTSVLYSEWTLLFLPFEILCVFVLHFALLKVFPPEDIGEGSDEAHAASFEDMGPLSPEERKVLILTLCTTLLWMTDFLHGLKPAWIGILAGMASTMPPFGILNEQDLRKANFLLIVFVGSALSLGTVLIETGTAQALAGWFFTWLEPFTAQETPLSYLAIYCYNFLLHLLIGDEMTLLVSTMPPMLQFSMDQGFNTVFTGLIWTYAGGAGLFVYQGGPLAAGYAFGYFTAKDLVKAGAVASVWMAVMAAALPCWWNLVH
ncbi:MAG: anion permease, partial [Desulfovibrionaceae bacterium]|nr:anion permease [Desulfovibrionaceae bacterium]